MHQPFDQLTKVGDGTISIVCDLNAALFNHKLLFVAAINTMGNAIASVNRFADERREKRGLRKKLCLQLTTMTTEINDEECCHISIELGVESVTRHSKNEIKKAFDHKSNQQKLELPPELIRSLL